MKKHGILNRGLGALASGLMLAAAFPNLDFSVLAWVALVPLMLAARASRPRAAAGFGFIAGLAFFIILNEWVRIFDDTGWVMLSLFMALYVALFAACVSALAHRLHGWRGVLIPAAAWTTTEWMRGHGPLAFTWGGLAYSQHAHLPLIQIAAITGPYGLTFLMAAANSAAAAALLAMHTARRGGPASPDAGGRRPGGLRAALMRLGVVGAAAALCWLWGAWRMSRPLPESPAVRVAVLQGSIGGEGDRTPWTLQQVRDCVRVYLDLTEDAARQGARIVVWPESAVPGQIELRPDMRDLRDAIAETARRLQVSIIVGSAHSDRGGRLNSAFLYGPDGRVGGRYDKVHLVPYGEYTPFLRQLYFLYRHFPIIEQEFSRGKGFFPLQAEAAPVGVAICFESAFPEIARALRRAGARVLVVMTNDAWFGERSATWQHFHMAPFRAVETGAYLARAATTGVSAILDPYGRSLAQSSLFERRGLVAPIVAVPAPTLYERTGDVVAWICAAAAILLLAVERRRHRV